MFLFENLVSVVAELIYISNISTEVQCVVSYRCVLYPGVLSIQMCLWFQELKMMFFLF